MLTYQIDDKNNDPNVSGNSITTLLQSSDSTSHLLMGLQFQTPLPDEGTDPKLFVDIHAACMEDVAPNNHPRFAASFISGEETAALSTWLPQTNADAVFPLPSAPTDYQFLKNAWQAPIRPIYNLVSTWATLSGASEGDALYTTYATYGSTSSPPSSLIASIDTFYSTPPLYQPIADWTLNQDFDIISVSFGPEDATQAMTKYIPNPNPAYSQFTWDKAGHSFHWPRPDYGVLGDQDPGHVKAWSIVYRPLVSYPSYGSTADAIPANARYAIGNENSPMNLSYGVDVNFTEPTLDANGRAIVCAAYHDKDATGLIASWSNLSAELEVQVGADTLTLPAGGTPNAPTLGQSALFGGMPTDGTNVALAVTWVVRKNGVWVWQMKWQDMRGGTLKIGSGL